MKHPLFSLFDEFDLTNPKGRISRILKLNSTDYSAILDRMDNSVHQNKGSSVEKKDSLDIWLPYSSEETLQSIPSYLFLFDKVHISDPLYDIFTYQEAVNEKNYSAISVLNSTLGSKLPYNASLFDNSELGNRARLYGANKLDKVISFFLTYKELVEEGVLLPFVDLDTKYTVEDMQTAEVFVKKTVESKLDEIFSTNPQIIKQVRTRLMDRDISPTQALSQVADGYEIENFVGLESEIYSFFITSLKFKSLFPSAQTPNLDLGGEKNKHLLDEVVKFGNSFIQQGTKTQQGIQWPSLENEVLFSSLYGIPSSALLSIRDKEKDVLDNFRYKMQKKLIDMKQSVGTNEHTDVIQSFQADIKGQVAEIELLANHIKKRYLRKATYEISLVAFSATAAILSASLATNAPLSLIGVGVSGSSLSTGIGKLIETWLSYKEEYEKIREKDSYILWKMQKKHYKKLN